MAPPLSCLPKLSTVLRRKTHWGDEVTRKFISLNLCVGGAKASNIFFSFCQHVFAVFFNIKFRLLILSPTLDTIFRLNLSFEFTITFVDIGIINRFYQPTHKKVPTKNVKFLKFDFRRIQSKITSLTNAHSLWWWLEEWNVRHRHNLRPFLNILALFASNTRSWNTKHLNFT